MLTLDDQLFLIFVTCTIVSWSPVRRILLKQIRSYTDDDGQLIESQLENCAREMTPGGWRNLTFLRPSLTLIISTGGHCMTSICRIYGFLHDEHCMSEMIGEKNEWSSCSRCRPDWITLTDNEDIEEILFNIILQYWQE